MSAQRCRDCDGDGFTVVINDEKFVCKTCDGAGLVEPETENNSDAVRGLIHEF